MREFHMEGVGHISGGEFDLLTVEGVGNCSNNIKAETIRIEGVFNCGGEVEAGTLHCKGVADFKSNIRAKKIYVGGVMSDKFGTKIEAEEITCDGVIKTGGEIYADYVKADGCIEAKEILGDHVEIHSRYHISRIIRFFKKSSNVNLIEATTIELEDVKADNVNGNDIKIGPNCEIENIDCSGVLWIDRSSVVKHITGNYTMREI